MADITGGVKITGFISPTDSLDTYAVIDPLYGIDGLRSVSGSTEKNAIPDARRREGMIVYQQSNGVYYQLLASPWTGSESDWVEFAPGTNTYVTGFTFNNANYQLTLTQNISGVYSSFTQDLSILSGDLTITGGTYNPSTGVATFTNNSGGTFNVTGFLTGYTDTYVTGGTYNPSTGILVLNRNNGIPVPNITGFSSSYTFTGGTVSGATRFTGGLTGNTISATTYQNIPYWTAGTGTDSIVQRNGNNVASGNLSIAMGFGTTASGVQAVAQGFNTIASAQLTHAEGYYTIASGDNSHSEGNYSVASGSNSHAEGDSTTASGNYSHAEGNSTTASGSSSHAEGYSTTASGEASHAEGYITIADNFYTHAEGYSTHASGESSHAEGNNTKASGNYSHAEGYGTTAYTQTAHAEGYGTTASGNYSHAEGYNTIAGWSTLSISYIIGNDVYINEDIDYTSYFNNNILVIRTDENINYFFTYNNLSFSSPSFIITLDETPPNNSTYVGGVGNPLTNSNFGDSTHAEGNLTRAIGANSHAGGQNTVSVGDNSFVHGNNSIVVGTNSIVLGANITGATNDTTYVDNLNIKTTGTGTSVNNLGVDADGNVVVGTSGGGGGTFTGGTVTGPTTFTNGLTSNTLTVNGVAITGDTYVTGVTFNNSTYDLSIFRNHGSTLTTNLSILASDMTITGGTYNPVNGSVLFTNNTGGTFTVTGFVTGFTDTRVTGGTYNPSTAIATFTNNSGGTFGVSGFSAPNGPTNSVQFNAGNGVFSGSSNFYYNDATKNLNLSGSLNTYMGFTVTNSNTGTNTLAGIAGVAGSGVNAISNGFFSIPGNYSNTSLQNTYLNVVNTASTNTNTNGFKNLQYINTRNVSASSFVWAVDNSYTYATNYDVMRLTGITTTTTGGDLWVRNKISSPTLVSNAVRHNVTAVGDNYTANTTDYTIYYTGTSYLLLTLPSASGITGQIFAVTCPYATASNYIYTTSSQKINENITPYTFSRYVMLQSINTGWITLYST